MARKRVNISMPAELYDTLYGVAKRYGLRGVCQLTTALLRVFLKTNAKAEDDYDRTHSGQESDADYIASVFDDLGSYEPTPSNTIPGKIRKPRHHER